MLSRPARWVYAGDVHATLRKFGYPAGAVFDDDLWVALVRPSQPTLGSLVLVLKRDVTSFAALTPREAAALPPMITRIERALRRLLGFARINYLMLMMVDVQVHFHVIPRYGDERTWRGLVRGDAGWPGVPVLTDALELTSEQVGQLRLDLVAAANGTTAA